jgi:hypothetical protein
VGAAATEFVRSMWLKFLALMRQEIEVFVVGSTMDLDTLGSPPERRKPAVRAGYSLSSGLTWVRCLSRLMPNNGVDLLASTAEGTGGRSAS